MPLQFDPIRVTDPDDPRIAEYRNLRENRLPTPLPDAPHGVCIAEGEKVVRLLLNGPDATAETGGGLPCRFRPRSVLVAERRLSVDREWLEPLGRRAPVYTADRVVMDTIVGFPIHRGVLASVYRLPEPPIRDLLAAADTLLLLEGIANHDNMGGLFRTAAALAHRPAILLDPTCCDPLYRKAIRVSMGHALRVPFATLAPWPLHLDRARDAGFRIAALTTDRAATDLATIERRPGDRVALLLGAEGPGLSPESVRHADDLVRITMAPAIDSLNVVTAAAVALHRLGGVAGGTVRERPRP